MTSALTSEGIVRAWEAGARRSPLDRAIALLWAADGGTGAADLPLAERDRRLLGLRQATFGRQFTSVTGCPNCGERVEVILDAADLAQLLAAPETTDIVVGDLTLTVRPLTSRDLADAAGLAGTEVPDFLRARLTGRSAGLPENVARQIDALIEEREAAGELTCSLTCADCGAEWAEHLDVAAHVWAEVEAAAHHLLQEVAEIAAAFGWSEAEAMALSEARRAAYLDIARGRR